ncbi:hypothetical protein NGRA_2136 [Nosema granulosis]|uniref:Uncharacterized protein n=1 Tax=Nosema granulosis TaxID=83296 RepID=A0A9P6GY71_9MICR|nr:hypothetical protein NGRA_2136 [Nosema granulosis]
MVSISKIEYNRKLKESFYHGLGFYTRMKVAEKSSQALEEILDCLERIEDNLTLEIEKLKNYAQRKATYTDKDKFINNNWCSNCKNNTHKTKTCYFLNRDQKKKTERTSRTAKREEKSCIMVKKKQKLWS